MTKQVLVFSDHPALSTGFARISDLIARSFARMPDWHVAFLTRECGNETPPGLPYDISIIGDDPVLPMDYERLVATLRFFCNKQVKGTRIPVICVDSVKENLALLDHMTRVGLRDKLYTIFYIPIDFSPLSPNQSLLFERADMIVPYSEFGKNTMLANCDDAARRPGKIHAPIPHSVDTDVFKPPSGQDRTGTRKRIFRAGEEDIVIGFFSRNTDRKRLDLVLLAFHLWSTGSFASCEDCGQVTVFDMDPIDLSLQEPVNCRMCGSNRLQTAEPVPGAKIYLHAEVLNADERWRAMGWDIKRIVSQLGLEKNVILEPALRPGSGLPIEELASRMGACDIHFLPYMGGGWELTVLETAACGVPNVIPDFATPPEYASPFSRLVPVEEFRIRRYGVERIIDIHKAVDAISQLAASEEERTMLGRAAVETARQYSHDRVSKKWCDLLAKLAESIIPAGR